MKKIRLQGTAVITDVYKLDFELDETLINDFCENKEISKEDFLQDPNSYAIDVAYWLNSEFSLSEIGVYKDSEYFIDATIEEEGE